MLEKAWSSDVTDVTDVVVMSQRTIVSNSSHGNTDPFILIHTSRIGDSGSHANTVGGANAP